MAPCRYPLEARVTGRGFAYLWVLLLVATLGAGLGLGAEIYVTATQRDKEAELLAIGHQFRRAIGRYYEVQVGQGQAPAKGNYPMSLEDLLQDSRSPGTKRHLRKIFVDPMTGKAEWGVVRVAGRIIGVHSLSEKSPIKQENFEAEDVVLRAKKKYSEWVFAFPADAFLHLDAGGVKPAAVARPFAVNDKPVPNNPLESSRIERTNP